MFNIKNKKIIKNIKNGIIITIIALVIFVSVLNGIFLYKAYKQSNIIKNDIYVIQNKTKNKDLTNLKVTIEELNTNSKNLKQSINNLVFIDKIPFVSNNIRALKDLSDIAILSSNVMITIYPVIEDNYDFFVDFDSLKIISIPKDQKIKIISSIDKHIQIKFDYINGNINKIVDIIKNKDKKHLIKPIKEIYEIIDSNYSKIEDVQTFFPLLKSLPEILGTPKSSKYLLLFQNNTEIRPTGGFIGTYGTVYLSNGEIGNVFTDNIYNLDRSYKNKIRTIPPEPIKQYLGLSNLYLRDANWNPDYEESAKSIERIYKGESQDYYPITGIIAVTPSVLQDIIGYFGEINTMGLTFNKENVIDLLNYETKFGYWETRGISESQRKIVIQKLSDVLFKKVKSLKINEIKELAKIVKNNLDKKQMLLYFNDKDAQNFVLENDWGGKMIDNKNSDYFAVIDANLSSGKSDPYIDKNIDYDLRFIDNELIATLSLTYTHRYNDYIKNEIYQDDLGYVQKYKSYTRIYVPEGSILKSLQINDDNPTIKNIDIKNENNKTYFGFYLTIPKNETYTYKFEYRIPKYLEKELIKKYSLIYQKQPGVVYNKININIDLNKPINYFLVSNKNNLSSNYYNKKFNINGFSDGDNKIEINFYSDSDISYLQKIIKKKYLGFQKEKPLGN